MLHTVALGRAPHSWIEQHKILSYSHRKQTLSDMRGVFGSKGTGKDTLQCHTGEDWKHIIFIEI